ncbi:hypothetical protein EPN15_05065 [Patescibacteria group bacterium]|nr:MAG: hypothetical protein EPN15_05065 [Patescibacteria group bacterium]
MSRTAFSNTIKAMNTDVCAVIVCDDEVSAKHEFEKIREEIIALENRFSRFKEYSELSKLNESAGGFFQASNEMIELLLRAKKSYEMTFGIFNPAILPVLKKIGYDKTFDKIKEKKMR